MVVAKTGSIPHHPTSTPRLSPSVLSLGPPRGEESSAQGRPVLSAGLPRAEWLAAPGFLTSKLQVRGAPRRRPRRAGEVAPPAPVSALHIHPTTLPSTPVAVAVLSHASQEGDTAAKRDIAEPTSPYGPSPPRA